MSNMIFNHNGHALTITSGNAVLLRSITMRECEAKVLLSALMQREMMATDKRARVTLAAYDLVRRVSNGDVRLTQASWGTLVTICAILGLPSMVGSTPDRPFARAMPLTAAPEVERGLEGFTGSAEDWTDEDDETIREIEHPMLDALR